MKALVLFGSESDKPIYTELVSFLERDFEVEFEVISAHRNPDRLDEKLKKDDFDFIVAGAGLAAHLPGVCASKTKKPVFGVPVEGNLCGLDALLSIQQMPFGIPVATMSARKWSSLKDLYSAIEASNKEINLVVNESVKDNEYARKEIDRTKKYAEEIGVNLSVGGFDQSKINLNLVNTKNEIKNDLTTINIPLLENERKNSPKTALELIEWVNESGFWFGINNTRNAVCFINKLRG